MQSLLAHPAAEHAGEVLVIDSDEEEAPGGCRHGLRAQVLLIGFWLRAYHALACSSLIGACRPHAALIVAPTVIHGEGRHDSHSLSLCCSQAAAAAEATGARGNPH
jgi:hypothetical protein